MCYYLIGDNMLDNCCLMNVLIWICLFIDIEMNVCF